MRTRPFLLAALVAALLLAAAVPVPGLTGIETVTAGRAYSAAL
jgi:hypothetical protein